MSIKLGAMLLLLVIYAYKLFLSYIERKSFDNPIPKNVSDIYDGETYIKWKEYSKEKLRLELISGAVSFVVLEVLFATNAFARFAFLFGSNLYAAAFGVTLLSVLTDTVIGVFSSYYDTMVIEEKYGFNRSTKKTFIADTVKQFVISLLLSVVLAFLLAFLHTKLGDGMLILFAIILFVLVLCIGFLFPYLSRIFNKFTPLEDGELKEKLTALLNKNGYTVRAINVMDGSRRSTKSNAYFTGFGKTKEIVLYDTMIAAMTPDEICGVFAHEMGHGIHKDTLKNQVFNFVNIALIAVTAWLSVKLTSLYPAFGFDGINYGFAMILEGSIALEIVSPLLQLLINWNSCRAEYRADAQAVKEGYADALISGLKKLAKENFSHLSPSKLLVKLHYSHPPMSERIAAIEDKKNQ